MKLFVLALAVLLVPVLALAQGTLPTPDDLGAFINAFLAASVNAKVALALVAAVWAIRKYAVKNVAFFHTDEGGVILLSITAFLSTLSLSFYKLVGPMTWSWFGNVCLVALAVAATSGGMWNIVQAWVRVLAPKLIASTKLKNVPFAGAIVIKLAEAALKAVKSKLDKVVKGDAEVAQEKSAVVVSEPLEPAEPADFVQESDPDWKDSGA